MLRQTGAPRMDENGMLQGGVVVRHLVLPGCREDSVALLQALYERYGSRQFLLSLMSQYTPEFAASDAPKNLHRRVTTYEYQQILTEAERLGFEGYFQQRESAQSSYTPDFGEESAAELCKLLK